MSQQINQLKVIGQRCFISNCIIDKNVSIGDDVHIVGGNHLPDADHEYHHVRDGIVIVPKGKTVPNGISIE